MNMSLTTTSLYERLDAIARTCFAQIEMIDGKRVYTSRTLTGCQNIFAALKTPAEAQKIEIRKGVGKHYKVFHPNPLTERWKD